jgi:hypothetical protein
MGITLEQEAEGYSFFETVIKRMTLGRLEPVEAYKFGRDLLCAGMAVVTSLAIIAGTYLNNHPEIYQSIKNNQ